MRCIQANAIATRGAWQISFPILHYISRSVSKRAERKRRLQQATSGLNNGVLEALKKRFQVRLYRFGKDAERIDKTDQVSGAAQASRIGDGLIQVLADSSTLPLGAVVLLSDGADNSGGVDRDTIAQIRERQVRVHTVRC